MKKISALLIGILVLLLIGSGLTLAESNSKDLETMPESTSGSSFLEEEAGITAYTKVDSVDLSQAKSAFKNIEKETDEYIVGSVGLENYKESHDPHVYVGKAGWIASYYLKNEYVSKIIDWKQYSSEGINTTKLERGIVAITDGLGTAIPYTKYFDFRYTNAEKIMIITDEGPNDGGEAFRLKIPEDFTVYSRSWSFNEEARWGHMKIDGTELDIPDYDPSEGPLSPSQLSAGIFHKIQLSDNDLGGIVLVYSE